MSLKIGEPYLVGELLVYFINENEALVSDYDCRYELKASETSCECCSFRFRSRYNPGFVCRHMNAVRKMKNPARNDSGTSAPAGHIFNSSLA